MRIFLSFNSKDRALAEELCAGLTRMRPSAQIFFSPVSIGPGFWLPKLADEIAAADAFLLLIGPKGIGPWQEVEYYAAFDRHVGDHRFTLVPLLAADAQAPGLPLLRNLNWVEAALVADETVLYRILAALEGEAVATATPIWKLVNPYRGLEAMTEANADYFYGRSIETGEVLNALTSQPERCPILIGASGVGKSSVAQAGVLSALKSMRWPGTGHKAPWPAGLTSSRTWVHLVMRPGDAPLTALTATVIRLWGLNVQDPENAALPRKWAEGLRRGDNKLADLIDATQEVLKKREGEAPERILLYVDQGEELYTRSTTAEARRFSEVLVEGLGDVRIMSVASLRADYFDKLQADDALFKSHQHINVAPLDRVRLDDVVKAPARALSVRFEDDRTAERITTAAATEPGALPLLSYLLTDMWASMVKRNDATLRLPAQVIDIGGVLASRAEEFLKVNPNREIALRRLLTLRLVVVPPEGEPVRRVTRREECTNEEWTLATQLADHPWRLVVTREREADSEIVAEVTHEALLRGWPRLSSWLREAREFLIFKGDMARAERRWRAMGMADSALMTGLDLTSAKQWLTERQAADLSDEERQFIGASIACAEATTRRKRQLSVAALCILLALIGAAIWEWIQFDRSRTEAGAARKAAENRLDIARKIAENQVTLVTHDLRYVQGIQINTVERLLQHAKRSFDELSSAVGNDPIFTQHRADMMSGFGETYLKAKGLDQAEEAYAESLQIYKALASNDPNKITWQRGIGDQIDNLGVVLQQRGKIDLAMSNFKQVLDIRMAIADREPNNPVSFRDLASSYYNIGEILMLRGNARESLSSHSEALENATLAQSKNSGNLDRLDLDYKLSLIHVSIGAAYEALGNSERRLYSYKAALDIRKRLVEANPDNAEWKRLLSWAYFWIGGYYLDHGNLAEALNNIKPCLSLRLTLAKSNPGDLVAKYDLAWAYHYLGMAFQKQGDFKAARENFGEAYNLRKELVDLDKNNTKWRKDLALSYESLGDAAEAQVDAAIALGHFKNAITILKGLVGEAPTNRGWRDSLALILNKSASIQKCNGDLAAALAGYGEALTLRSELLTQNPNDLVAMLRAARSENLVGEVLQLQGEMEGAFAHYRQSAELGKRMLERNPEYSAARDVLTVVQKKIDVPTTDAGPGDGLRACANAKSSLP